MVSSERLPRLVGEALRQGVVLPAMPLALTARLPFLVAFEYLDQGIRVHGQWYPVLKMDWVEGFMLNHFVEQHLAKPEFLERLSHLWLHLARLLHKANLAYGDLQHGNVMVVPGTTAWLQAIKLVDYDGIYIPALARQPSGEVGHANYQHPGRLGERSYGPEVDRFSHLVIYTALRALAVGGQALWERYDTGDNLLFRQRDFEAPQHSSLFAELLRMENPEVRELVVALIHAARMPLDQTPLLDEVLAGKSRLPSITAGQGQVPVLTTMPEDAPSLGKISPPGTGFPEGRPAVYPGHTLRAASGEEASSFWETRAPPVRVPLLETAAPPEEVPEASGANVSVSIRELPEPPKYRSFLTAALIGIGALILFCLGFAALISKGCARRPTQKAEQNLTEGLGTKGMRVKVS